MWHSQDPSTSTCIPMTIAAFLWMREGKPMSPRQPHDTRNCCWLSAARGHLVPRKVPLPLLGGVGTSFRSQRRLSRGGRATKKEKNQIAKLARLQQENDDLRRAQGETLSPAAAEHWERPATAGDVATQPAAFEEECYQKAKRFKSAGQDWSQCRYTRRKLLTAPATAPAAKHRQPGLS